MSTSMIRRGMAALLVLGASLLSGCGYNTIVSQEQGVKAAWAEVLNQYQRRADLIPNIVNTVKGEAGFEQETLTKVVEARAKATSIQATPELVNDPEAFKKFTAAQGELTGALSRLLVVAENYPNLKANAGFQDLRTQLEGTENRIAIARNKYIKEVQQYNTTIALLQNMLGKMLTGAKEKPQFAVENEAAISKPPTVDFNKK
ncbi:MAG TPA: LemA family protein [Burkholderiaceae bacterium]|nr:LemA family protein [Burkholderiaceae bacterium]